jgi:hypothetical protein
MIIAWILVGLGRPTKTGPDSILILGFEDLGITTGASTEVC